MYASEKWSAVTKIENNVLYHTVKSTIYKEFQKYASTSSKTLTCAHSELGKLINIDYLDVT